MGSDRHCHCNVPLASAPKEAGRNFAYATSLFYHSRCVAKVKIVVANTAAVAAIQAKTASRRERPQLAPDLSSPR